jgi:hypothetical protein
MQYLCRRSVALTSQNSKSAFKLGKKGHSMAIVLVMCRYYGPVFVNRGRSGRAPLF